MFLHVCPVCNHRNPRGSRFCNDCGSPLQLRFCPNCGTAEDVLAIKCHACGVALPDLTAAEPQDANVDLATQQAAASMIAAAARDAAITVGSNAQASAQPSAQPSMQPSMQPSVLASTQAATEATSMQATTHPISNEASTQAPQPQTAQAESAARAEPLPSQPPLLDLPAAVTSATTAVAPAETAAAPTTPATPQRSASIIERLYPKGPAELHTDLQQRVAADHIAEAKPAAADDDRTVQLPAKGVASEAARSNEDAPAAQAIEPNTDHEATPPRVPIEPPSVLGDTAVQADELFAPDSSRITVAPLPQSRGTMSAPNEPDLPTLAQPLPPPRAPVTRIDARAIPASTTAANTHGQTLAQRIAIGALLVLVLIVGALVYSLRQQFTTPEPRQEAAPQPITPKSMTSTDQAPIAAPIAAPSTAVSGAPAPAPNAAAATAPAHRAASTAPADITSGGASSGASSSASSSAGASSAAANVPPQGARERPAQKAGAATAPAASAAAVDSRPPSIKRDAAASSTPRSASATPSASAPRPNPVEQRPCTPAAAALGFCEPSSAAAAAPPAPRGD
jgi:hypothetical protein